MNLPLSRLASELGLCCLNCNGADFEPRRIATHSSNVAPGDLFVAIRGDKFDGHNKVDEAFAKGALACVVMDQAALRGRPGLVVEDTRRALSALSAIFEGHPSQHMTVVGVTGTNGKTTTTSLIYNLLWALKKPCLRVGTLGVEAGALFKVEENFTTPEPHNLQGYFRRALDAGVKHVTMESSSHALQQERLSDVFFDVAVFTNLTRDHLDYHGSMEEYLNAKLRLLDLVAAKQPGIRTIIVNADSEFGAHFSRRAKELRLNLLTYGYERESDFLLRNFEQSLRGLNFSLGYAGGSYELRSPLIGKHNSYNIAAAMAVLSALGFEFRECAELVAALPQVPGRLESVPGRAFGVYVDYAHTPDALQNVLTALRPLAKNALWVVFGCGGDRDKGKRPIMAQVAAEFADKVVVTSDNPRTENAQDIIGDILQSGIRPHAAEVDRRSAIRLAVSQAMPGDVILIAGKGHEDYQVLGKEKIHFSDVEEVQAALQLRND